MKRIFALLLAFACTLSLSACGKNESTKTLKTPKKLGYSAQGSEELEISADLSDAESSESDDLAATISDQKNEPVFIEDIHEWAEDNVLYNINNTYEITERYYMPFERIEQPTALWYGAESVPACSEKYDPVKAVEFAKAHWDDGLDVCAPFISRCLKAGDLSIGSDSSTALCLMLLNSRLGFGQFIPINDDTTVTLPDYARPGDIVQIYCSYEGLMTHSLMFVGNDENGHMKVCCHNSKNSGRYAFHCGNSCYSCLTPLSEVFYFHFYGEGEEPPEAISDNNILLFENTGYAVANQHYDRQSAVEAVMNDPIDGIGQFGAEQTSAALTEGGINVGTPIQTALFMRLMKSQLGSVHSIPINPDRTVTLPEYAEEGDVCFLCCPEEMLIYNSFIIKGTDANGKMLGYSRDKINDENSAFRVESVCPSSICDAEIKEVLIFHFDK